MDSKIEIHIYDPKREYLHLYLSLKKIITHINKLELHVLSRLTSGRISSIMAAASKYITSTQLNVTNINIEQVI